MPNADKLTPEGRFMGLFVGPTKGGKSVAGASFPGPIKILDFDGRIRGLLGAPWIDRSQIDYDSYPPRVGRNQKAIYEKINEDMDILLINAANGTNRYKTLQLSSLTSSTFAMLCDAVALTHSAGKGKSIGTLKMPDPQDYGFEAINTYNLLACLRSVPNMNIIVDAHIIDRYGRSDPDDKYSERIVIGEKLSLRDKIAENVGIYFDHCFKFEREMLGETRERYTVEFHSDLASTSYPNLPFGKIDITGKSFYNELMRLTKDNK